MSAKMTGSYIYNVADAEHSLPYSKWALFKDSFSEIRDIFSISHLNIKVCLWVVVGLLF